MPSRYFYLFIIAALLATPARADDSGAGAAPIAKMEKADKAGEPEAPSDESRMQIPDTPKPTGEKPPVKADTPKTDDKVEPAGHHDHAAAANDDYGPPTLRVSLTPSPKLEKGKAASFTLGLATVDGAPILEDGLDERHTKKIHILVADESFSDYQHVHPKADKQGWSFTFTPETEHDYRMWVDVKPKGGNSQMIPLLLNGNEPCKEACVDNTISMAASFGDNKATLSFDNPPTAGAPATGTVELTGADGKPLSGLEPVMGAYAHVVAFSADGRSVAHVHPMGDGPQKPEDRGASPLKFMIHPKKAGILKIFVQIATDDKDIFLPFTVKVDDAAAK
jgi:hypothetical protein